MVAMWRRMREYLGQTWVRERGDVESTTLAAWEDALADFSEDQIARGVKACQDWKGDFPPTIGQFKELCLTVYHSPNHTEKRMALENKEGRPVAMIEHLERSANSEIAKRELEKMKRILEGAA